MKFFGYRATINVHELTYIRSFSLWEIFVAFGFLCSSVKTAEVN